MIIAVGTDLCAVARMELAVRRTGERFLRRVFTAAERDVSEGSPREAAELSRRFAVKESTFKVLGRGWPHGVGFNEIESARDVDGRLTVRLTGRAKDLAARLGIARLWVASTDDGELAVAIVVAEGS